MKNLLYLLLFVSVRFASAQDAKLVQQLDQLRRTWDDKAIELKSFAGLSTYCKQSTYRIEVRELLDEIHHYDSVLLKVVNEKIEVSQDKEAIKTLTDIQKLEEDYKTRSFQRFLRSECAKFNEAEQNKAFGAYENDKRLIEKELNHYISAITVQIDLIDEHAHHLIDK